MRIDALQLHMRPRSPWEAADLGIRLAQQHWRELFACHAVVALPLCALCIASHELAAWLPLVLLFLAKPWLGRASLFVLSRAAFGQRTRLSDLWQAQRQVLWRQFLLSWSWRRLSPWRSFTQAIYQLEGLPLGQVSARRRQLRRGYAAPARLLTVMFALLETLLVVAAFALLFWLIPTERGAEQVWESIENFSAFAAVPLPLAYAAALLFIEPFYVAAGFAMYLNRRAELEAWDVEQELRRAFAS
jgi:hypothetical protein